jgi:hypothetical protein
MTALFPVRNASRARRRLRRGAGKWTRFAASAKRRRASASIVAATGCGITGECAKRKTGEIGKNYQIWRFNRK